MLLTIIDISTALATVLVMWNHDKHKNWWILYTVENAVFAGLMAYKGLFAWAIAGVIFVIVGIKNYREMRRKNAKSN